MSHASDIFPYSVKDKLFKTDRGDVCLYLHEAWPSLLIDLGMVGPAMLISRSEQMALVSLCRRLDFVPVPGSTEMLELRSGLCLETLNLGAVIAGQEAHSGNLTFQFFDLAGYGLFKVVLAPGSDVDAFIQLVSHYGKGPLPPVAARSLPPLSLCDGAVMAEERSDFQAAWTSFDPTLGGDLLPGGSGVSWLDAFRLAGRERATFLTKVGLTKAILAAHRDQSRLRITSWHGGIHHIATVVPYRLERCGQCFHLIDVESEAHFFFETDLDIWVGFHGKERVPAIHLFSPQGQRRALIQLDGDPDKTAAWRRELSGNISLE